MPSKEEEEILKLSESLVALLKDDKPHTKSEVYAILNNISKVLGPSYQLIPSDLKKGLGIVYGSAIAETDTFTKAVYTRTSLSLLRAAVKIARGPKKQLDDIDNYIRKLEIEIRKCEMSEEPLLDELWKKTNRAVDYVTLMMFNGYGEIRGDGFKFNKPVETKEAHHDT